MLYVKYMSINIILKSWGYWPIVANDKNPLELGSMAPFRWHSSSLPSHGFFIHYMKSLGLQTCELEKLAVEGSRHSTRLETSVVSRPFSWAARQSLYKGCSFHLIFLIILSLSTYLSLLPTITLLFPFQLLGFPWI